MDKARDEGIGTTHQGIQPLRGWGIQFTVRRGTRHVCTDLPEVTSTIACPFTGEELMAVPAPKPDVAISSKGRERT
jgi:acyl CoA:acetate/3-ketoacid CoA transferase alpha subunit